MAQILFPTSDGRRTMLGAPLRARACRCRVSVVDGDELCLCGFWPEQVIRATWRAQARRMASIPYERNVARQNAAERPLVAA